MKSGIVVFPGSNRDGDVADALHWITGTAPLKIWHRESDLPKLDLVVVPGGFSYGDYLRCGAIAAQSPIMRAIKHHAEEGRAVLGICNGFQIITEAGLLPGALLRNAHLKFVCKNVWLRVENAAAPFTSAYKKNSVLSIPVAHHDGNYFAEPDILKELEDNGQVAFRYCNEEGDLSDQANPNGSIHHIAGIFNKERNILGLMPHPENAVLTEQSSNDGRGLFHSILESFR